MFKTTNAIFIKKIRTIPIFSLLLITTIYLLCACSTDDNTSSNQTNSTTLKDISMCVGSTEDSLGFTWFSNEKDNGILKIIKSSDITDTFNSSPYTEYNATSTETDNKGYYSNKVSVAKLEPSTEYTFIYGNNSIFSEEKTFTTSDFSTNSVEFLAFGDPQLGVNDLDKDSTNWQATIKKATDSFPNSRFILTLGDQTNEFNNKKTISKQYTEFFNYINVATLPVAVVNGNHEVRTSLLMQHVNLPNQTEPFINEEYDATLIGDYYFKSGNALIMVLNCSFSDDTQVHENFIKETLDKNQSDSSIKWRIVAFHQSIYSAAGHVTSDFTLSLRDKLSTVLYDNSIDLVFMGHDHVYIRTYPMGKAISDSDNALNGVYGSKSDDITLINIGNGTAPDIPESSDNTSLNEFTNPSGPIYVTLNSSTSSKHYDLAEEKYTYGACISQENTSNYSHIKADNNTITVTTYTVDTDKIIDYVKITK